MGVKNLNKLIKRCPLKDISADYLIIDGYNVIITYIQSLISCTRDNVVGRTIIEIFHFMVHSVAGRIKSLIERLKTTYKVHTVYFIIDGLEQKPLELSDGFVIDIKEGEHIKRKQQMEARRLKLETELKDNPTEMERRFFEFGDNYHHLIYPIVDELCNEYSVIVSVYEADYTIANLANTSDNSIVVSVDTDFYIMCCDSPTVYIYNFRDNELYCPWNEWHRVFDSIGVPFSADIVYRLAPLFGNDYTSNASDKQNILAAECESDITCILLRDAIPPARRLKLCKLKNCIQYSGEVVTIEELDSAVQLYSETNEKFSEYNSNYCKSVAAYTNMSQYFDIEDYEYKGDGSTVMHQLFTNPAIFGTDEFNDLL